MEEEKLKKYRQRRHFTRTNEPVGSVAAMDGGRFSVQHHMARTDHYDLRLELGGVALSWALPKGPSFSTADRRLAVRVEDHPVSYMDFEGTIPEGEYGGGTVMLWDEGTWTPRNDAKKGLREGSLKLHLEGERLKGDWALVRMKPGEDGQEAWLFIKERDGFVKRTAGIGRFTRGVRSGRTMREIEAAAHRNPFGRVDVMLASVCDTLPSDMGWVFELKYDGHRTLGYCENGDVRLKTRNGNDCTARYPLAAEALKKLFGTRAAVVDGEMVVVGQDGVPDFGALQAYGRQGGDGLAYVLFDLLALDGVDLRARPLLERKEKLKALLQDAPAVLAYSAHTERMTKGDLAALKRRGMEGVVAKRANSLYTAGKNGDWRKLKLRNTEEFVVGGYAATDAGVPRTLCVGVFGEGGLHYAGRVGAGLSEEARRELATLLEKNITKKCPFSSVPKGSVADMVWVKPVIVVQVAFAERTRSGRLRQASLLGVRTDKSAAEVTEAHPATPNEKKASHPDRAAAERAVAGGKPFGVLITHPEKQMFPEGLTKGGLAAYYAAAAERMLPHLKDRLLSLVCCPAGITGERFFRRHLEGELAGVGASEDGFFVKSARGLLSLVQQNAVELHVWGSRRTSPGRPDGMVFDLDPDEALPVIEVQRGARQLREVLGELGLTAFIKTSGGKGYHLVVPLRAGAMQETVRDFAKRVAVLMETRYPTRYTATMSKSKRSKKIFIDWQRNTAGATSVAPYSVRARAGAPVSMPVFWEELEEVAPASVTVYSALRRLEGPDPWADFFTVKARQSLKK